MSSALEKSLADCAEALAHGNGNSYIYAAVEAGLRDLIGHRLFTLLALSPSGAEVERFYSSDPDAYPLTGRKTVGDTPWGRLVLDGKQPYLGRNAADIRWAFGDHELIESLGLRSVINIPILQTGKLLGTMNLLDAEDHYDQDDLRVATLFGVYLVSSFRDEVARIAYKRTASPDKSQRG